MTIADWILTVAIILLYAALACSILFLRNFLPPYLVRKGEDLATKEDIEELTHKVEGAKSEYAQALERLRSDLTDQLSILEKRRVIYSKIACSMGIFLADRKTCHKDRQQFLDTYAEAWLWANDAVLKALNQFLDANIASVNDPAPHVQNAMQHAYAQCMLEMRKDCGFSETDLHSNHYKFVSFER